MKMHKLTAILTSAMLTFTCLPGIAAHAETEQIETSQTETEQAEPIQTEAVQTEAQGENEVQAAATYPYQDTSLSFEERAADLVARMTLEEKAAQTAAKSTPAISRLGVHSYYYWREGIHGVARQGGATSFPSSLAMSNTWDRQLMYEVMDITSTEARAKNNRYDLNYWNPTINLARDPRWGRNEETYGEDPYLTTEIGGAAVKGMQGTDEKYLKTITTLKHYAANNVEGERQRGTSIMNESTMREYYTRAFRDIVENYSPGAVMSSYNATTIYRNGEILKSSTGQDINYVASSANSYLINDLLRRTYGFDGFVVGDCGAWDNLYGVPAMRKNLYPNEALENITAAMTVSKALDAGSSLDCNSGSSGTAQVASAVQQGLISEDLLDIAVYELFLERMKTGEFDDTSAYRDITSDVIESDEHVAKAEQAAEESWVLLENNGTLPLENTVTDIAIVGDHADEVILGDYSADMESMTSALISPYSGIKSEVQSINQNANVELIGNVNDSTPLLNIKSIKLIKSNGSSTTVDLSSATNIIGMMKSGSELIDITKSGMAVIPNVDFQDVTDVQIEAASLPGMPNVTIAIGYNSSSQNVANVDIESTSSSDTYQTNTGTYNGATGGYTSTANMYITINAAAEFSVENYKSSLDKADYIIAYGGTTTADSSESNDRSSINLPASEAHIQQICDAYPEKTIVVLQTVGQVNVEGFKDKCAALLWTSYNGQTQGEALGKVLTGSVNPSGKLSTTWYSMADLEKMPLGTSRQSIDGIDYNFTSYELAYDINNPTAEYPGRTYQYYTGTPIYPFGYGTSYTKFEYSNIAIDKTNADANDTVTITADVKNTGSVSGTEVAQLYITVPGADGKNLPLKQLKGFERVELAPGETKTVSFSLDISDVYFFDEAAQKNYVVSGEYTAKIGSNSDDISQSIKFNVSGSIAETLKNAYAVPSGLKLYIAQDSSGKYADEPGNYINSGVSVALKDDQVITSFAEKGITLTYSSSNPSVAIADSNGIVKAGTTEGTATITVTASKAGSESVTTSFPVVTQFTERISDSAKAEYLNQLDEVYLSCPKAAYTAENWETLNGIYTETRSFIENELLESNIPLKLSSAIDEIMSVPKITLAEEYDIISINPNIIKNNRIEYSKNGIGTYTATDTSISGTITVDNPCTIDLAATDNGTAVGSDIIWTVEKLDGSSRKSPEIDASTGRLTIYENGIFKVTASNYTAEKCGSITVYANLQIEGESADSSGGADLNDSKDGASGGMDAGSTGSSWLRFDGVKLDKLTDITFRVSQASSESTINVSLMPNTDWIIATADAPVTGAWNRWTEVKASVNRNELSKLELDENGCGSVYIQTNKANLDYIKLNYSTLSIEAVNQANGVIKVTQPFNSGVMIAAAYNGDKSLKSSQIQEFTSPGEYTFNGFAEGDSLKIYTWNSLSDMMPLDEAVSITYSEPAVKALTVYNFSDSVFDSYFDTAGGTTLPNVLGMSGYGGWNTDSKKRSCTYDGRTYTFTRGLKGGKGALSGEVARAVFFTPDTDGVVTAMFEANTERCMYIHQEGREDVVKYGNGDGVVTTVSANVKAGIPVYIYGGGSNKDLYAVLFEANKTTVEETPATATPEPTATPTPEPLPEIIHEYDVQFEDYTQKWGSGTKGTGGTGTIVENTKDGDIYYYGEQNMDGLAAIRLSAAIRSDAGTATATFYAADVSGIDVSTAAVSDVNKLLTDENRLGSVTLMAASGWNTYYDHQVQFNSSGTKGLFVKLNSTGKYCGNFDYMHLMYTYANANAEEINDTETLTAENDSVIMSVTGDKVTAVNKYTDAITEYSYNEEYNKDISFEKLTNWNGIIVALVSDNNSGSTSVITTPMGSIWIDATPDYYSEKDDGAPQTPVINDICPVSDQLYLACNDGWLITMTSCSKCSTLKKICDFDIKELEYSNGILYLSGIGNNTEINIGDVRQENIKGEAALELAENGAILVDVRSAAEFAEYSFEGSINVPIDEFSEWLSGISDDNTIIVYCASGVRSAQAMEIAKEQGFTNIYNLGSIDEII